MQSQQRMSLSLTHMNKTMLSKSERYPISPHYSIRPSVLTIYPPHYSLPPSVLSSLYPPQSSLLYTTLSPHFSIPPSVLTNLYPPKTLLSPLAKSMKGMMGTELGVEPLVSNLGTWYILRGLCFVLWPGCFCSCSTAKQQTGVQANNAALYVLHTTYCVWSHDSSHPRPPN